jgi:uncharacterized caspase-like protein
MNSRIWLLFILLVLPGLESAGAADARDAAGGAAIHAKVALVIGNTHYVNALPLVNPENDANDMCAALTRLGFDVICKLDIASKREFKDAIYDFTGKIDRHTVAVFYFAGHGVQIDGVNYLIPTKAALRTKSDIEDESIQINYLMNELDARQAALNIFFLDACRNNPFANPLRGYVPMLGFASQLYAPRNSIIAMSTGAGQLSLDGNGRNGTFTRNLLKNMATPNQPIEDMLMAVSSGTRADANGFKRQQDPQIMVSYTDKFCLAGCAGQAAAHDHELLKTKTAELNRLQATLADTKSKQAELDSQQALLLKKRAELDTLRQGLDSLQSKQEELARRQAEVTQRERELDKLNTDIKASTDKLKELETVRLALQKKQEELDRMRKSLALQESRIDADKNEIKTREIKPAEKKVEPITIPAF